MSYEEFISPEGHSITYIQCIQGDGDNEHINYTISKDFKKEDETYELEEYIIENEEMNDTPPANYEVLESVVSVGKRIPIKTEEITKELIRINKDNKIRGRKRLIADQTREIRKQRANTNKPYINSKGNEVKPKEFDESFVCTCPKKCTDPSKLPLKIRKQIFKMFWSIGSYEGRCAFLNSCVSEAPKKKQYTKNAESRRKFTRKHFLKGVEVCKRTFVKTLQISNSRIDVSLAKMETENFSDERGKRKSRSLALGDETKEAVINHIKNYFNADTTLRGLWNAYQATHDNPVSESYYKRIFYDNFNLKVRKISKIKEELEDDSDETE